MIYCTEIFEACLVVMWVTWLQLNPPTTDRITTDRILRGVQPTVAMGVDSSTLAQAASKGQLVKVQRAVPNWRSFDPTDITCYLIILEYNTFEYMWCFMSEYIGCFGPKTTRFLIVMMNLRREMCSFSEASLWVPGQSNSTTSTFGTARVCLWAVPLGDIWDHLGNLEVKAGHRNPTCLMLLWNPVSRAKKLPFEGRGKREKVWFQWGNELGLVLNADLEPVGISAKSWFQWHTQEDLTCGDNKVRMREHKTT